MRNNAEANRFRRRSIVCAIGVFVLFAIVILRLMYLQIIEHRFYNTLSERNVISVVPVTPTRGIIYDRNGVVLAKNVPVYSLMLTMDRVKNLNSTLDELKSVVDLTPDEIKTFEHIKNQYYPYQAIPLKQQLTEAQVDHFYVDQYRFPGVTVQTNMIRSYPLADAMSSAVGYVGRITTKEFAEVDPTNYTASDSIGKAGAEEEDEVLLHGKTGSEQAEIDANGKIVRILKINPATPGDNLYLTIDSKLQVFAEKALGANSGAVVAMDPSTGEVLALASNPSYDPNIFSGRMSQAQYKAIMTASNHPLFNRATRATYAPGSTVKPFIAFSALNDGVIDTQDYILDEGWFRLPNTDHIFHNWKKFGWVNVTKAIMVSCDTFFYQLATVLGIDRLDQALTQFGFGELTGINLPSERAGVVPSPEWKEKVIGQKWYTGDTVVAGIGQGYMLSTPLQLANAISIMGERGIRFQPNVLLKLQQPNGAITEMQPISEPPLLVKDPKMWETVIGAMQQVAMNPQGTAYATFMNSPYTIAGKSGTAQINRETEENTTTQNDHLFICFAPVDHPKIAVAVVIERIPGMSQAAVKVAKQVIDFYFNELKEQANPTAATAEKTAVTTPEAATEIQQDLQDDLQQEMRLQKADHPQKPEDATQLQEEMDTNVNTQLEMQSKDPKKEDDGDNATPAEKNAVSPSFQKIPDTATPPTMSPSTQSSAYPGNKNADPED